MAIALAMAAAGSAPAPGGGALIFDCDVRTPAGGHLALRGTYSEAGFRTNLAELIELPGDARFEGGPQIGIEDHLFNYRWTARGGDGRHLDVEMAEYSRQNAAVLTMVWRRSDGRHVGYTLIGTGMCETRRGSPSAEDAQ
jgi:hypothetical protein